MNTRIHILETYIHFLKERKSKNIEKLSLIFSYWLDDFFYLNKFYLNKKIININEIEKVNINKFLTTQRNDFDKISKTNFLKKILKNLILFCLPLKKIFYTGSESLCNKFDLFKSNIFISYVNEIKIFDEKFKNTFVDKIDSTNYKKNDFKDSFFKILPNTFFSKNFDIPFASNNIYLYGSPLVFITNYNFIKIFFLNTELYFHGFQHGSNYGFFKVNKFENYELNFSNKYFYWFGKENLGPTRFKKNKKYFSEKILLKSKFIIVGQAKLNEYLKYTIKGIEYYFKNDDEIISFFNKTDLLKKKFYFFNYYSNKINPKRKKIENFINPSFHVLIFSSISSTMLYYAILKCIPFVIISKKTEEDIHTNFYYNFIYKLKCLNSYFEMSQEFYFKKELINLQSNDYYLEKQNQIKKIFKV